MEEKKERPGGVVVHLEPEMKTVVLPKARTVLAVLNRLGVRPTGALVIRDGGLLTPDVRLKWGEEITVRMVASSG